ncbi:hypothetical protein C8E03_11626 [Lachnotalea glycerini]|uniref:DUF3006 domain-containing protein n=2 Tax=Lachnotalea glycerini TaxID=1763509 RepID=A0A318EH49_9FIRM|nr:DUF3006 domain-containing protein [Lachnotalea glycerini]OYO43016.1 hypothetical protein CG709_20630 [Lachnotalea glycerini]PXV85594.1 hypothetical protein C8E03_11626 [Lachnotalea glycerini]
MKLVIDRFEGKFAVCVQEDHVINIPRYKIPIEAKDGDCIEMENGFFVVRKEETEDKRYKVKKFMDELKKKNKC